MVEEISAADIALAAEEVRFFILRSDVRYMPDFNGLGMAHFDLHDVEEFTDFTRPGVGITLKSELREGSRGFPKQAYRLECFKRNDCKPCLALDMVEVPKGGSMLPGESFTIYNSRVVVPRVRELLNGRYKDFGSDHLVRDLAPTRDGNFKYIEKELLMLRAMTGKK